MNFADIESLPLARALAAIARSKSASGGRLTLLGVLCAPFTLTVRPLEFVPSLLHREWPTLNIAEGLFVAGARGEPYRRPGGISLHDARAFYLFGRAVAGDPAALEDLDQLQPEEEPQIIWDVWEGGVRGARLWYAGASWWGPVDPITGQIRWPEDAHLCLESAS